MLFPSVAFIFAFLPITLIGFHLLGRWGRPAALGWLSFMSIVFYAAWRLEYVPLLLGSILFNFACARWISATVDRPGAQRLALTFGIAGNLGLLSFYKYLFPVLDRLESLGIIQHHWGSVLLPLGISFFTFTQIGYLVDLRSGTAGQHNLVSYTLFVTFFPHLIAGPILHHKEIMPQFSENRKYGLRATDFDAGLSWFILGLAKKLLLADQIAQFAAPVFHQPHGLGFFTAWGGALAYAIQLYFDFSGYSDMAIGLARMFSIQFPLNFNSPYKAANIIDFWQRWHMTLTRYITLYLYNPLTLWGTRKRVAAGKGASRKALATPAGFANLIALPMIVTMTLAGIWHGAGPQYLVFGLLHGFYLTVNHAWRTFGPKLAPVAGLWKRRSAHIAGVALTFLAVIVAQVFFRADSVSDATALLSGMFGLNGFAVPAGLSFSALSLEQPLLILAMLAIIWTMPNTQKIMSAYSTWHFPGPLRAVAYSIVAYMILFGAFRPQSFIYFQF